MIWKNTKRFGIGKATTHEDGMFCTYIVSLYDEKGNNRDEYANNVLKGAFDFGYCDSLGKDHRQTFRRYQRGKVESKSSINNTIESNTANDKNKSKDIAGNIIAKHANKTTIEENTTESVLRPEDIVLSIKKIDPDPPPIEIKQASNTTRSTIDKSSKNYENGASPLITNNHHKNKSTNSIRSGNKKIIVDNLMQLNDFVMKVSERTKSNKKKSKKSKKNQ